MLTAGQVVPLDVKGIVPEAYRIHRLVDATGDPHEERHTYRRKKKSREQIDHSDDEGDLEEDSFYSPLHHPRTNKSRFEALVESEGLMMRWNQAVGGVQLLPDRVLGEIYTQYSSEPPPEEPSSFRGESVPQVKPHDSPRDIR